MLRLIRGGLAALLLSFAAPAAAEPALWAIRDADSTIYLYGTVHYLRPGTDWRTARVSEALSKSQELILEIADNGDGSSLQAMLNQIGYDPTRDLSTKLKPKDRARLAAAVKSLNLKPDAVEEMQPWYAALTLSVLPAIKAGYDPQAGVEQALSSDARRLGLAVQGLETTGQQLHFMADLSETAQVEFLSSTLDEIDGAVAEIDSLVKAWAAGDLSELEKDFVEETRKDYPGLYEVLIKQRNAAWADALKEKLDGEGVSFVAVGAGHLVGPDSVQAELAKRGVKVERLN